MKHIVKKMILSVVLTGLVSTHASAYFDSWSLPNCNFSIPAASSFYSSWYEGCAKNSCVDYVNPLKDVDFSTAEFKVAAAVLGVAVVGTMARCATKYYYANSKYQEIGKKFGDAFAPHKGFKYATWRTENIPLEDEKNIFPTVSSLSQAKNLKDLLMGDAPECEGSKGFSDKKNSMLQKIQEEKNLLAGYLRELEPYTDAHKKIVRLYRREMSSISLFVLQLPVGTHEQVIALAPKFVQSYLAAADGTASSSTVDSKIQSILDSKNYQDLCGGLYINIYDKYLRLYALECLIRKMS